MSEANKDATIDNSEPIHWKIDHPASEGEVNDFWKKLRHFYRTGEKKGFADQANLSSALVSLLDNSRLSSPYSLQGEDGVVIERREDVPFHLLSRLLTEHQRGNRKRFKAQLSELASGLSELFKIKDETTATSELQKTFDFAEEMIAFDKMAEIIPTAPTEYLSGERLERLQAVVDTLNTGLKFLRDQAAMLVIEKQFAESLSEAGFIGTTMQIDADDDAFEQVQMQVTEQIHRFADLIRAYRIASLELTGDYQEETHDEYFEHFTWHRLFREELDLFHPVVLVVRHAYVVNHLTSFSRLLSSNLPVSIMVVNEAGISAPNEGVSWEDASHQFRQELAALVIAHRNVYMFQAGLDNPEYMQEGLTACLRTTGPGVCHVLLPERRAEQTLPTGLTAMAAKAGRYFPTIKYDPAISKGSGGRLDVSGNPQPESSWPPLTLKAKTSAETEAMIDVDFTYADYKAFYPEKTRELVLIPSAYYTEHLVPLSDYLNLDEKLLYGKIPFIWLIDDEQNLHRAAVPNLWVVSCQERLDFWTFLQELGGVRSYPLSTELPTKDDEMKKVPDRERPKTEAEYQQVIARVRDEAMLKATERLISVLLTLNEDELALTLESAAAGEPVIIDSKKAGPAEKQELVESAPATPEPSVSSRPYVDSDDCTSCNECTGKFPKVFAYNEDKQAYVKDASKGTYADIVKAAENCPAACIHPGLPLNPHEPNVEALIKRAAKFG